MYKIEYKKKSEFKFKEKHVRLLSFRIEKIDCISLSPLYPFFLFFFLQIIMKIVIFNSMFDFKKLKYNTVVSLPLLLNYIHNFMTN